MDEKFQLDVFESSRFKSSLGISFCGAVIKNAEISKSEHYKRFYVVFTIGEETYDYQNDYLNRLLKYEDFMADYVIRLTSIIDEIRGKKI